MKKILLFLLSFFLFFPFVKAENIENIFNDIDKNYTYYNELKVLYERGIILPDKNGNFNPKQNLTRDEFVGIVSEISCKECIQPNVDFSLVQKYSNSEIFFDIGKNDKYFYCIAEANNSGQVTGYQEGTVCQNGVSKDGQKPFCPANNILLEEALAIILRAGNILSISEAEKIRKEIETGTIFPNIGNISPKLGNGNVYSFYPDFKKAYEYNFTDYDKDGNKKNLKLLDFTRNVDPKKFVTREDFLRISYIALKNNSCASKKKNDFGLKMEIFEKTCSEDSQFCKETDFPENEKIFDFKGKISRFDDNGYIYNWRFYDYETGNEILKTGKFIDNYDFLKNGKYRVYLNVTSPFGENSEIYTDIKIGGNENQNNNSSLTNTNNSGLTSLIKTDKNGVKPGEFVNLTGTSNKGNDVTYSWDLGNGKIGNGQNISTNFLNNGTYTVTLTVTDSSGNTSTSTVNIKVSNNPDFEGNGKDTDGDGVPDDYDNEKETSKDKIDFICKVEHIEKRLFGCNQDDLGVYNPEIERNSNDTKDTDGDGVPDKDDKCPLLKGKKENFGCPIFEKTCKVDSDCGEGKYCENGYCKLKNNNLNCAYTGGHIIKGDLQCNSCPCDFNIDYNAKLRACDIIFPAITSPDNKDIYGKGKYFQIKK